MADEDFEDDYDDANETDTGVQLGFVEMGGDPIPLLEKNWNDWDGGKCGGRPIWLNPSDIPGLEDLKCPHCKLSMIFLLQIYSPLDEPKDAFHRVLYLFVCRRRECVERFSAVKCIRCQLPRSNPFYSTKPDETIEPAEPFKGPIPFLCALCGCRAPHKCSRCKAVSYCSKEHQKVHWKLHKKLCNSDSDTDIISGGGAGGGGGGDVQDSTLPLPLLFPEYEISVTAEVLTDLAEDANDESVLKAHVWEDAVVKEGGDAADDEDDDDSDEENDAALTQKDYSKALGNEAADPTYMKFIERCRRGGPQQVLRYDRWSADGDEGGIVSSGGGAALQLTSDSYLSKDRVDELAAKITPCQHCGAPRKFEFQVMPQLLHFLKVDRKTQMDRSVAGAAMRDAQTKAEAEAAAVAARAAEQQHIAASGPDGNSTATEGGTATVSNGAPPVLTAADLQENIEVDTDTLFSNDLGEDIDWGTIDVYTCTASCSSVGAATYHHEQSKSAYLEELVVLQAPLGMKASSSATAAAAKHNELQTV